jgi:hypothetical protein
MRKLSPWLLVQILLLPLLWSGSHDVTPGSVVARWPIKTSLPASADVNKTGAPFSLQDFLALAPAADNMTTAFRSVRYPETPGAKFGEGAVVRTSGYVRLVAGEPDGDFHIQLSVTADTFDNSLVVEVPKDDPAFVTDTGVSAAARTVRNFVMTQLKTGDPTGRVVRIVGPAYVEVTGQLFFDAEHQAAMSKGVYRGKSIAGQQLPSKTSWVIHPITRIAFAPRPK